MTDNTEQVALLDGLADFNRRLTSIIENDALDTAGKNLAIGLLVTLRAPMLRNLETRLSTIPNEGRGA